MHIRLGAYADLVRHYPYETASVNNTVFAGEYAMGDPVDQMHRYLAGLAGRAPDNKEVFAVEPPDGPAVYVEFWDWRFRLGLGVNVRAPDRVRDIPKPV